VAVAGSTGHEKESRSKDDWQKQRLMSHQHTDGGVSGTARQYLIITCVVKGVTEG